MKKALEDLEGENELATNQLPSFGRYQLRQKLGQGGMGVVYRAYDTELKRDVALKTILCAREQVLIKRFTKEAEAMAKLAHQGLVKIYDVGKVDGRPYLTMEFIEGKNLAQLLKEEKLSPRRAAEILNKVAQAIAYAHSKGILHRDLKPSNIMIGGQNEPKVMDFGLALDVTSETKLSHTGSTLGTPAYMSPEQTLGKRKEIDERSDVYALGVVLYEMLVGAQPFRGMTAPMAVEILEKEPPAPSQLSHRISRDISNICLKAMAKDKKDRYQSVSEMAEDLQRFLAKEPVLAHGPRLIYRAKRLLRQKLNMVVVALVSAALALLWSGMDKRPAKPNIPDNRDERHTNTHVTGEHSKIVERLMSELGDGTPEPGMSDRYVTEIVRMKSSETVKKLLSYLYAHSLWQRRAAIEALGKLGDGNTRVDGHDVVEWLLLRLPDLDLYKTEEMQEAHDIIWALGRIADGRAFTMVSEVRQKSGENSVFWENTKIPHSWLPLPPKKNATTVAEYVTQALALEDKGDLAGAIGNFSKALELDPSHAATYNNRGKVRAKQGDFAGAISDFTKAIAIDPTNALVYNNRGVAWASQGDSNRAVSDYNKAIALRPQYAEAYANRASLRLQRGDMISTISDSSKAIELNPQAVAAYNARSHARLTLNDINGALADANKAIALNPNYPASYMTRGNACAGNKNWEGAISDYSKAIELNPQDANAYFNRGNVRDNKGDRDGAISDYGKAIELQPNHAEAYGNRGQVYDGKGDIDKAISDYSKSIELNPKNVEPYVNRGLARHRQGDWEAEMSDYNAAIHVAPLYAKSYFNRGMLWVEKNEPDNAVNDFTKAIELDAKLALAYKMRGTLRMKQNNHEAAANDLMRYIHMQPEDPDNSNYFLYIKKYRTHGR
jgi:serine/threonine protein kinase/Flp pilus assembly protein TadD